jgi:hypothetical protein
MPTVAARESEEPSINGFLSEVKALTRAATAVEKLPPTVLRRAFHGGHTEVAVREIDTLHRHIERMVRTYMRSFFPSKTKATGADKTIQNMVRSKELLDPAAFIEEMGWSRQALSKALAAKRVFFVDVGTNRYFPAFFASKDLERRKVEAVSKAMGDLPGGAKLQFFLTPKGSLSRLTPLQALAKGQAAAVQAAAESYAQA